MQNKVVIIFLLLWNLLLLKRPCTALERVSQHPSNILHDYLAYRQIAVIHFSVPENAAFAVFKFTVKEEKAGGIGKCSERAVSIHLKSGSIPLVRPDNSTIKTDLLEDRRHYYSLQILSDGVEHDVKIDRQTDALPAGDWYAIAFRSWFDPDSDKITQQGLGVSCDTVLDAELLIEPTNIKYTLEDQTEYSTYLNIHSKESTMMRFYIPRGVDWSELSVQLSCDDDCTIIAYILASEILAKSVINTTELSITFRPQENSIHYALLRIYNGTESNVSVTLNNNPESRNKENLNKVDLIRKSYTDFFFFEYEHTLGNDTKSSPVNLSADTLSVLKFKVGSVFDIGGTLSVGLKFAKDENNDNNIVVVGCISLGYYSTITSNLACERRQSTSQQDIYLNSTEPSFVYIPYPEPGVWYLTLKAFCKEENSSCPEDGKLVSCENCTCMKECSARVDISITSNACVDGDCNDQGSCMIYSSGGLVFSACDCVGGYRGFDCTDDTYVLDSSTVVRRVLLLTLSNLAFIISIFVAVRREYYTEAIVYAAVLFSSTFYHACEAGDELHSFCIMRLSVLQFCDFYNALLSIWVTLVAMVAFGPKLTAFSQMAGAIVIALCAQVDRTALWVFLVPAITGCCLIGLSWTYKCRAKGSLYYPARRYRMYYLPPGLLIVFIGLICYAFLQTRSNYYLVHSFWHICVAIGAILLLPKRQYMAIEPNIDLVR